MCSISWLERSTVDSILMEALPLLKSIFGALVIVFGVPVQHVWGEVDTNFLAVGGDNALRIVQEIVCVDDSDADFSILQVSVVTSEVWANVLVLDQEVEDSAELVIARLGGHEVIEASNGVQGWNSAAEVGWNAVTGVTNEESEVELLQDLCRDNGGISGLSSCVVWVRCLGMSIGVPIGMAIGKAIGKAIGVAINHTIGLAICSDALLHSLSSKGWSNGCWLSIGRDQVVRDILDEESFPLHEMSFRTTRWQSIVKTSVKEGSNWLAMKVMSGSYG